MRLSGFGTVIAVGAVLAGCAMRTNGGGEPVPRARNVDLGRYMGPWFVLGGIGLWIEKGAHDAMETYAKNPDGSIATIFQFRKDAFDGTVETKPILAWADPSTGDAEWRVRTIWPLKQQYVISHVEPDYSVAIVARDSRDYVWILSRTPRISDEDFERYRKQIAAMGYDLSQFSKYPHDGRRPDGAPLAHSRDVAERAGERVAGGAVPNR